MCAAPRLGKQCPEPSRSGAASPFLRVLWDRSEEPGTASHFPISIASGQTIRPGPGSMACADPGGSGHIPPAPSFFLTGGSHAQAIGFRSPLPSGPAHRLSGFRTGDPPIRSLRSGRRRLLRTPGRRRDPADLGRPFRCARGHVLHDPTGPGPSPGAGEPLEGHRRGFELPEPSGRAVACGLPGPLRQVPHLHRGTGGGRGSPTGLQEPPLRGGNGRGHRPGGEERTRRGGGTMRGTTSPSGTGSRRTSSGSGPKVRTPSGPSGPSWLPA